MMRGTIKAILLAAGLVSSWGGGAFAQQADRSPQAQDALTRGFARVGSKHLFGMPLFWLRIFICIRAFGCCCIDNDLKRKR